MSFKAHQPRGKIHNPYKGYSRVYCPDHPACDSGGHILLHRLIMEHHLKRYLTGVEVVHHINGDPRDNRVENLEVCASQSEHMKKHSKHRTCSVCGKPYYCRGLCITHYARLRYKTAESQRVACFKCGKDIAKVPNKDKQLCRACRYPNVKCVICGSAKIAVMGLCREHADAWAIARDAGSTYQAFKRLALSR